MKLILVVATCHNCSIIEEVIHVLYVATCEGDMHVNVVQDIPLADLSW